MALTQIDTGGIKDDAVTDAKLPANSVGNSEMKDDAVGIAELSATGTASSSTFLRGDNSWVTPTDTNTQLSTEEVQDIVGAMFTGNTETNITATYQDSDGTIDLVSTDTNTQLAFANDANNRVVTGDGSGGLNGEANLTFDGNNLTQAIDAHSEGFYQTASGAHLIKNVVDSNRASANDTIYERVGRWNGKNVAGIQFSAGSDTTNKDDGYIVFKTSSADDISEKVRIDSSGKVGIGTTSPTELFSVNGGMIEIRHTAVHLDFMETGNTDSNHRIRQNAGNLYFQKVSDDKNTSTDRLVLDGNGNVGIGTTSPTGGKLHISHGNELGLYTSGGYNYQAKFESTDAEAAIVIEDSNSTTDYNRIGVITNDMVFTTNNVEHLRINSAGAVTKPKSPAFAAYGPNSWQTITHSSSAVTLQFDTEHYDAGANFNTSTYRFTAPVDGAYQFLISLYFKFQDSSDASAYATLRWNKNGSSDNQGYRLLMYGNHGKDDTNHTDTMAYALSANDYVTVTLESEDQDVKYYPGHSFFSGYLIG